MQSLVLFNDCVPTICITEAPICSGSAKNVTLFSRLDGHGLRDICCCSFLRLRNVDNLENEHEETHHKITPRSSLQQQYD